MASARGRGATLTRTLRGPALLVGATFFWAIHFQLSAVILHDLTPMLLTFWRWTIAAVPLLVIAQLLEHPDWRLVARHLPRIAVLSLLGLAGYNLLLYYALASTTPVGASLVNASSPAIMAMLSVALVRQRVSARGWLGIGVSLVGVVTVITEGSLETLLGLQFNLGQLLMLVAVVIFSIYTIFGRIEGVGPVTSTAVQAVITAVATAPFAATEGMRLPGTPTDLVGLLVIALLPSVASYAFWNLATATVASSTAAIYLNLVTVFVVAIGAVFGQPVSGAELIGGALVIAGVVVTSLAAARENRRLLAAATADT